MPQKTRMNLVALTFARAAGVEPHLENWPDLRRALLFGPLAPSCFRLEGPDAVPEAPVRFARQAAAFGAITSNELTERERSYWSLLKGRLRAGQEGPIRSLTCGLIELDRTKYRLFREFGRRTRRSGAQFLHGHALLSPAENRRNGSGL